MVGSLSNRVQQCVSGSIQKFVPRRVFHTAQDTAALQSHALSSPSAASRSPLAIDLFRRFYSSSPVNSVEQSHRLILRNFPLYAPSSMPHANSMWDHPESGPEPYTDGRLITFVRNDQEALPMIGDPSMDPALEEDKTLWCVNRAPAARMPKKANKGCRPRCSVMRRVRKRLRTGR